MTNMQENTLLLWICSMVVLLTLCVVLVPYLYSNKGSNAEGRSSVFDEENLRIAQTLLDLTNLSGTHHDDNNNLITESMMDFYAMQGTDISRLYFIQQAIQTLEASIKHGHCNAACFTLLSQAEFDLAHYASVTYYGRLALGKPLIQRILHNAVDVNATLTTLSCSDTNHTSLIAIPQQHAVLQRISASYIALFQFDAAVPYLHQILRYECQTQPQSALTPLLFMQLLSHHQDRQEYPVVQALRRHPYAEVVEEYCNQREELKSCQLYASSKHLSEAMFREIDAPTVQQEETMMPVADQPTELTEPPEVELFTTELCNTEETATVEEALTMDTVDEIDEVIAVSTMDGNEEIQQEVESAALEANSAIPEIDIEMVEEADTVENVEVNIVVPDATEPGVGLVTETLSETEHEAVSERVVPEVVSEAETAVLEDVEIAVPTAEDHQEESMQPAGQPSEPEGVAAVGQSTPPPIQDFTEPEVTSATTTVAAAVFESDATKTSSALSSESTIETAPETSAPSNDAPTSIVPEVAEEKVVAKPALTPAQETLYKQLQPYYNLATAYVSQGNTVQALKQLNKVIKRIPQHQAALWLRAQVYSSTKEMDNALKDLLLLHGITVVLEKEDDLQHINTSNTSGTAATLLQLVDKTEVVDLLHQLMEYFFHSKQFQKVISTYTVIAADIPPKLGTAMMLSDSYWETQDVLAAIASLDSFQQHLVNSTAITFNAHTKRQLYQRYMTLYEAAQDVEQAVKYYQLAISEELIPASALADFFTRCGLTTRSTALYEEQLQQLLQDYDALLAKHSTGNTKTVMVVKNVQRQIGGIYKKLGEIYAKQASNNVTADVSEMELRALQQKANAHYEEAMKFGVYDTDIRKFFAHSSAAITEPTSTQTTNSELSTNSTAVSAPQHPPSNEATATSNQQHSGNNEAHPYHQLMLSPHRWVVRHITTTSPFDTKPTGKASGGATMKTSGLSTSGRSGGADADEELQAFFGQHRETDHAGSTVSAFEQQLLQQERQQAQEEAEEEAVQRAVLQRNRAMGFDEDLIFHQ